MPTNLLCLVWQTAERLKFCRSAVLGKQKPIVMEQPKSATPRQLNSAQVVFRLVLRLALLSMFATFGTQGFGKTFAALLALSVVFCVVTGTMRREALFGPVLMWWTAPAPGIDVP